MLPGRIPYIVCVCRLKRNVSSRVVIYRREVHPLVEVLCYTSLITFSFIGVITLDFVKNENVWLHMLKISLFSLLFWYCDYSLCALISARSMLEVLPIIVYPTQLEDLHVL